MRLLVTGGAGFIGSNFVRTALDTFDVTVLDCLTYAGAIENLPTDAENLEFVYGSVCDVALVDEYVAKADYVIHFAAETHVARSIVNNRVFFETDVIGTQTIAQACLKHDKPLLHFSTSEVYGTAIDPAGSMDEDHPLNPMSPYAAAKCGADRLVYSYFKTYGLRAVIARSFNVYGPRQHPEKLIPRFITNALRQRPMTIHGDGEAKRDFVHVSDVCRAITMLMASNSHYGEVFNIGTGNAYSVNEISARVRKVMDPALPSQHTKDRPGQVSVHRCDYIKIYQALGWFPEISFYTGLAETATWYSNNPQWQRQLHMAEDAER